MVNPLPATADPQRYLQILEQLNQKWKEIEVRTESILSEQENAQRFSSRILQEANSQNESIPCLVHDHQLLTRDVRSIEAAIKYTSKRSIASVSSRRENAISKKSIASVSSRKEKTKSSYEELSATRLNVKEKVDNVAQAERVVAVAKASTVDESVLKETTVDAETTLAAKDSELKETTGDVMVDALVPKEIIKRKVSASMDIGCHFIPTDQELIACLVNKVTGGTVPRYIQERDLYGNEEPRDIFKNNPASELYFVTPIKTKFDSGKKVDRIVGNGTWKIQNNKDIFDDPDAKNKVIGCKRTLNFMENTKGKRDSWIMHEYILKDTPLKDQARWAVCRVKRGRGNFTGLPVPFSSSLSPQTSLNSSAPTEFLASLRRPLENDDDAESNMPPKKKLANASDGLLQLGLTL